MQEEIQNIQPEVISTTSNKPFEAFYAFSLTQKDLVPKFSEVQSKEYVLYGEKNTYPLMIMDAYNSSALFKSVVNNLIIPQVKGLGFRIKDGKEDAALETFIDSCNKRGESLHDVFSKVVKDYIIFNGFTTSIVWTKQKDFQLYHTDFSTIRCEKFKKGNTTVSNYYFSNDWSKFTPEVMKIPAFNFEKRNGTQLYNFHSYEPNTVYYPVPRYSGALSWITIDIRLGEFFNSYLESGCFPALMVNITNGDIDSEEKAAKIVNQFMSQFQGSAKTGRVVVAVNASPEDETKINPISSNNDDEKFEYLSQYVLQQIVSGFGLNDPQLAGIPTPGNLRSSDIAQSQAQFNTQVIEPIRNELLKELNFILKANGFENQVEVIPTKQPVIFDTDSLLEMYYINELRKMRNDEPLPEGGDVIPRTKSNDSFPVSKKKEIPSKDATQGGTPGANASQSENKVTTK